MDTQHLEQLHSELELKKNVCFGCDLKQSSTEGNKEAYDMCIWGEG